MYKYYVNVRGHGGVIMAVKTYNSVEEMLKEFEKDQQIFDGLPDGWTVQIHREWKAS